MKVIVFGATGKTGQQLVSQALAQGYAVTAFARKPEKISRQHENLQIAQGNVLNFAEVKQAMLGQDAVLCALGAPAMNKDNIRANGTKNIIRAMQENGVKRLVCQSALGCNDSHVLLPFHYKYVFIPLLLRHVYHDHELQEEHITASSLDWVIVRPGVLSDEEPLGHYWHGLKLPAGNSITAKISRADIAAFMLQQLGDDTYLHKSPSVSYVKT